MVKVLGSGRPFNMGVMGAMSKPKVRKHSVGVGFGKGLADLNVLN